MTLMMQDLRFAARGLWKRRAFTGVALLTLALGIGANTAMFSVVNSVLLSPTPFQDPDRLVFVWASSPSLAREMGFPDKLPTSPAAFYDWKEQSRSLARMAMMRSLPVSLSGDGDPEVLGCVRVTGEFFPLLGVQPTIGRTLLPEDDDAANSRTVVLSQAFWQRRFGGDPSVIGRILLLDARPATIVGVMPPRFAFPRGAEMPAGFGFAREPDVWLPMALSPEEKRHRGNRGAVAIARLAEGVHMQQAQAELATITRGLQEAFPETDKGWGVRLDPLPEQLVGDVRPALLLLLGAVGLVLLIACANVASLWLAQATARQREISIRIALGASRRRLVAQLLTESLLVSALGGVLGLLCAFWTLRALVVLIPASVPGADGIALDGRVLAFTAAVSLLTGVTFGLLPALQASRPNPNEHLKEGLRTAGDAHGRRTGNVLVGAQMALAVIVTVGAGLLVRSFALLMDVDPGFRREQVLTFLVDLPSSKYSRAQRATFVGSLLDRLRALPGVAAAGAVTELPMTGLENLEQLQIEGRPLPAPGREVYVDRRVATPGYFAALGIPLRKGRTFTAGDTEAATHVAIISEALARAHWPQEDPIGRRLRLHEDDPWLTIIGVVGDVRHSGLQSESRGHVYQAHAQFPRGDMFVAVRSTGDPAALRPAARAAVAAVDKDLPIARVQTMTQVVSNSVAGRRFNMVLLGLFAGLALLLSAVGIYGLTSYSVGQRVREMGLRLALGARPRDLLRLVLGEALRVALAGVLAGLLGALALGRIVSSLLYGVKPTDPATFAAVMVLLSLISIAATAAPGLRATRVDPMVTLREE